MYWPAVGTVRFAIACTMKFCVRPPNAASPDQSIVGLSTSTFGVWPALIGQISLGAPAQLEHALRDARLLRRRILRAGERRRRTEAARAGRTAAQALIACGRGSDASKLTASELSLLRRFDGASPYRCAPGRDSHELFAACNTLLQDRKGKRRLGASDAERLWRRQEHKPGRVGRVRPHP